jgi:F0F1-type ATP synthase membrane subunit c/vacuolar-type H+-ATPase subunit K
VIHSRRELALADRDLLRALHLCMVQPSSFVPLDGEERLNGALSHFHVVSDFDHGIEPIAFPCMDATQLALTVASIAALAGIVQASVQGWVASRTGRIVARQDAIKSDLAFLQTLHEQLSAMGQAANEYTLVMFEKGFYSESSWRDLRKPALSRLLTTQGAVYCSAYALPAGSNAQQLVLRAAEVAAKVGLMDGLDGDAAKRNAEWTEQSHVIRNAVEAIGTDRRRLHIELQTVTRNVLSKAVRRIGYRPSTPDTLLDPR